MKEVLDTHAVLSPLPFEKVTPAIAKMAPSVTAAVKAVMLKEGAAVYRDDGGHQNPDAEWRGRRARL